MCAPCDAAKQRLLAASRLREAVEEKFGLGPALKTVFSPLPPSDGLLALAAKLDN